MIYRAIKPRLLTAVGLGALLCSASNVTLAQQAPEVEEEKLEEIIVTGLKRDQNFMDVPVSVQIFGESEIQDAGITRPQDYLSLTPNVTFITANHAGEFFVNIRGQASVRQSESAVAVIIDGVQLSTQNEFNGELFDLQQIEVLKGPQAAIYGRNASAGAIVIKTKDLSDDFSGQATVSYGSWNSIKSNLGIGGSIVPGKLRFRAAFSYNDSDGPFTNIITGEKPHRFREHLGRLRLEWQASDKFTLDLRANASRGLGGAIGFNAQIVGSVVGGVSVPELDMQKTDIPFVSDVPGRNQQDKLSFSAKADYDFDGAILTSVTSWAKITDNYQAKNFPYASFSHADNQFGVFAWVFGDKTQKFRIANKAFTQEFRLTSDTDSPLQWQAGIYFMNANRPFTTEQGLNGRVQFDEGGNLIPPVSLEGVPSLLSAGGILPTLGIDGIDTVNPTVSYDHNIFYAKNIAPFGNIQYSITDNLELSAAVRYDIEKRKIINQTPDIANTLGGLPTFNMCVLTTGRAAKDCQDEATFKQMSPKASLTYSFEDNASVFISYGKGFKSGGFNPIGTRASLLAAPGADPSNIFTQDSYDKEVADAYEIGFKSVWADGKISLNGAVFLTNVKGAQQFEFFPNAGIQAISQIDKARMKGIEFDFKFDISKAITVFGGYGYVDTEILELRAAPQFEGNRTPYSSNYNFYAGAQMAQPLENGLTLLARAQYTQTGSIWYDASQIPGSKRNPVGLMDARIGLESDRWVLSIWSKNLFDKHYNAESVPLLTILQATYRAPTQSYGMELRVKF